MTIRYDHIQDAKSEQMIIGGLASLQMTYDAAVFTDYEIWRAYINPGFDATIKFLSLYWEGLITSAQTATLTGKLQIRARGKTAWTDLLTVDSISLPATNVHWRHRVFHDAVVGTTDAAPWEVRWIITTSASAALSITFGSSIYSASYSLATRTVGESA